MIDIGKICAEASRRCSFDTGRFYGPADLLSIGAGLLYSGVRYPLLNQDTMLFDTVEGMVLVLTHECDVDPENLRPFSELVALIPITTLRALIDELVAAGKQESVVQIVGDIAANIISRVLYLPPADCLPEGGLVYLNQTCSSHISMFATPASKVCALSAYGLMHLDYKLENHFRRPKAEMLSLSY